MPRIRSKDDSRVLEPLPVGRIAQHPSCLQARTRDSTYRDRSADLALRSSVLTIRRAGGHPERAL
jgi:hypothetical protein